MDVMLLTSCHPNVSMLMWWEDNPPECPAWGHMMMTSDKMMNMSASEAEEMVDSQQSSMEEYQVLLDQWEGDLEAYDALKDEEATMVMYSLQILVWYMTTFVLLLRHASLAVLLSILAYSAGALCIWHGRVDFNRTGGLELLLLIFSFIVVLVVKSRSECQQRKLFELLKEKKLLVIDERVKRYTAEYENEQLSNLCPQAQLLQKLGNNTPRRALTGNRAKAPSVVSSALSSIRKPPPSTMSAPPTLHEGPLIKPQRRSGECLPPDAVVWVEGQALPQALDTVRP
eukprot:1895432-Amphidinium_carterae.1